MSSRPLWCKPDLFTFPGMLDLILLTLGESVEWRQADFYVRICAIARIRRSLPGVQCKKFFSLACYHSAELPLRDPTQFKWRKTKFGWIALNFLAKPSIFESS